MKDKKGDISALDYVITKWGKDTTSLPEEYRLTTGDIENAMIAAVELTPKSEDYSIYAHIPAVHRCMILFIEYASNLKKSKFENYIERAYQNLSSGVHLRKMISPDHKDKRFYETWKEALDFFQEQHNMDRAEVFK